jgi:hypothetical protein
MLSTTRSNLFNLSPQLNNTIISIKTVHVRWPARPAEHRAGLEFSLLLSLFQDKESKENSVSRQKVLQTLLGKQKKERKSELMKTATS